MLCDRSLMSYRYVYWSQLQYTRLFCVLFGPQFDSIWRPLSLGKKKTKKTKFFSITFSCFPTIKHDLGEFKIWINAGYATGIIQFTVFFGHIWVTFSALYL